MRVQTCCSHSYFRTGAKPLALVRKLLHWCENCRTGANPQISVDNLWTTQPTGGDEPYQIGNLTTTIQSERNDKLLAILTERRHYATCLPCRYPESRWFRYHPLPDELAESPATYHYP